jgi:hypothetical protein
MYGIQMFWVTTKASGLTIPNLIRRPRFEPRLEQHFAAIVGVTSPFHQQPEE